MYFWHILHLALAGIPVFRKGWFNKFHLGVDERLTDPTLMRVADDGSFTGLWPPTMTDIFTPDWVVPVGVNAPFELPAGSFGAALEALVSGAAVSIRRPAWHQDMFVTLEDDDRFGRILVMHLPNGTVQIYPASAPQDLAAMDWRYPTD